jgi:hypothetical protein
VLAEQGLSPADLDRALVELERTEGTRVRAIVWINEDGLFGTSRADWQPDRPDARDEPFIPLLWLKVDELLGRVPEGSTARFVKDGRAKPRVRHHRLSDDQLKTSTQSTVRSDDLSSRRHGLAPGGDLFAGCPGGDVACVHEEASWTTVRGIGG